MMYSAHYKLEVFEQSLHVSAMYCIQSDSKNDSLWQEASSEFHIIQIRRFVQEPLSITLNI